MGKNFFYLVFFLLLSIIYLDLYSQISEGGVPRGWNLSSEGIPVISMPVLNKEALLEEDRNDEALNLPFRFGYPHEVNIDLLKVGKRDFLFDGTVIIRLKIHCPEATTINLTYSDFYLPAGAKYFIYSEDRSELIGAFTNKNNNADGLFATGLIRGENIMLELQVPSYLLSQTHLVISTIVHGYKDIFKKLESNEDFGSSGACNINVKCPRALPWENEVRSVAMILTASGSRLCSGVMVNNVRQDLTPYFLTANHCLTGNPSTWIIMFNYQSPTCANINGPLNYTVSGTQLRANNSASDFALLRLNQSPPDTYYVHYAGWSAIDVPADSGAGIHHPSGDIKKISFSSQPFEQGTWSGSPPNSHWRVRWHPQGLSGVTEPGSSGSPIFNQNKRIVGQLHGGPSSCTATDKSDLYGKFSMSWNYGTTPSTRLRDWLDPDNTGTLVLDGWDPTLGTPDTIPPTQITDLQVVDATSNSLRLVWTAPLDTSHGGVRRYIIKSSSNPITDTISFNNATTIPNNLIPKAPGQPESFTVSGLNFNSTLYFAIRSSDRWNNLSNISNSPSGTTLGAPSIGINPTSMTKILLPQQTVIDSVTITNTAVNPSTLNFNVSLENNTFPGKALQVQLVPKNKYTDANAGDKESPKEVGGISLEGQGGPDPFGYRWIDSNEPNGPQYVWNDIRTNPNAVDITNNFTPNKDDGYQTIPLGITFPFYGTNYTTAYLSTNGFLSFTALTSSYLTNAAIPSTALPNNIIAAFWDDLDGRTQGTVHRLTEGNKTTIQFTNWQKYNATGSLTFQIVLFSSGRIMIYYNTMNAVLNSATVGIENATGTVGLQVVFNANYVQNNMALKIEAAPEWLIANRFSGMLYSGNSVAVQLTFKAEDFPMGNYSMDMVITSNSPTNPTITVPIQMQIAIPVELGIFRADAQKDRVKIEWETITETNNSGFEVQRKSSTSSGEWEVIGFVQGTGTTTQVQRYQYFDNKLKAGKYSYRLKQIDYDGRFSYSREVEVEVDIPSEYGLSQNYPNPFNPLTNIEFSVPEKSVVRIDIYSALGELVRRVIDKEVEAGYHSVSIDGSQLPSGTYIYQMTAQGKEKSFIQSKKMTLIK